MSLNLNIKKLLKLYTSTYIIPVGVITVFDGSILLTTLRVVNTALDVGVLLMLTIEVGTAIVNKEVILASITNH